MYHLSFADQIISFSKSNRAFHPLLALVPSTSTHVTLCFKSPHNKTLKTNQYIVQNVAQQCVAHKLAISFSSLISSEKFHSPVCAPVKRFSLSPPCECRRMKGSNLPFWHIINTNVGIIISLFDFVVLFGFVVSFVIFSGGLCWSSSLRPLSKCERDV